MEKATRTMEQPEYATAPTVDRPAGSEPPPTPESEPAEELLVEEIRIDDLSIDGMCGVY